MTKKTKKPKTIEAPARTVQQQQVAGYHFLLVPLDKDHKVILKADGEAECLEVCAFPEPGASDFDKLLGFAKAGSALAAVAAKGLGIGPEVIDQVVAQAQARSSTIN